MTLRALHLASIAGMASMALASGDAEAAREERTLYLTRGAPLAIVDATGTIRRATCGARRSKRAGNRRGDTWTRLDAWGRRAETVRVTESSVYDLSGCREIGTTGRSDTDDDPALYVRGPRTPAPTAARPFACAAQAGASLPGAFVFCTKDARGRETTRAITGGTTLRIARFDRGAGDWRIDRTMSAPANDRPTPATAAFEVVAVLDMNGDGNPEIVVHSRTSDAYEDTVYTMDATTGALRVVAETGSGYA